MFAFKSGVLYLHYSIFITGVRSVSWIYCWRWWVSLHDIKTALNDRFISTSYKFNITSHFIINILPEIMKHDEENLDHSSDFIHANQISLHYSLANNVSLTRLMIKKSIKTVKYYDDNSHVSESVQFFLTKMASWTRTILMIHTGYSQFIETYANMGSFKILFYFLNQYSRIFKLSWIRIRICTTYWICHYHTKHERIPL